MFCHFILCLGVLSKCLQVLGDVKLRRQYDANGVQGLDVNFMDACEFFTMLFGSDRFQHLIGELMLATAARNSGEFSFSQHKLQQVTSSWAEWKCCIYSVSQVKQ